MPSETPLYDRDFFAWTHSAAEALRQGRLPESDVQRVAEEIEDMGKRDRREVYSRMTVLVMHLMKWAAQPQHRRASWTDTIGEQRVQIDGILEQSPSLRPHLVSELPAIFRKAAARAAMETKLPPETFQVAKMAMDVDRLLDPGFLAERLDDLVG